MKTNLHLSIDKTPAWQIERARILHRICKRIQARRQAGESLHRAIRRFSRRWHGRPFKSYPSRTLQLAAVTLRQKYRVWRLRGQDQAAFKLNYISVARRVPGNVLIRFINLAAESEFKSCKSAWRAFCQRGGNAGPGHVRLGYDALLWNLPDGFWRELKNAQKAKRLAQAAINQVRFSAIAQIQAHVPARIPRRPKREITFEI